MPKMPKSSRLTYCMSYPVPGLLERWWLRPSCVMSTLSSKAAFLWMAGACWKRIWKREDANGCSQSCHRPMKSATARFQLSPIVPLNPMPAAVLTGQRAPASRPKEMKNDFIWLYINWSKHVRTKIAFKLTNTFNHLKKQRRSNDLCDQANISDVTGWWH